MTKLRLCDLEPGTEFSWCGKRWTRLAFFTVGKSFLGRTERRYGLVSHKVGSECWLPGDQCVKLPKRRGRVSR